uniref:L-lactate dehydrogenase n=1 Tax=Meloidogyne javanica TaxID=6303 RepID=A0A915NE81_MELJA
MAENGIFVPVAPIESTPQNKVTIVGVGQVGMACAYSILQQNIATEICLTDVLADKLQGEMMDLQHGLAFTHNTCIVNASTDYAKTAGSKICVITAGCRQREGESRLSLIERNVVIFKGIVPQLVLDILTYVTWKLSGLPKERVFGSGTNLDSARFRFLLSERLNISPCNCHAFIIGEHGDSSVAVWSGVNVAGVNLSAQDLTTGTSNSNAKNDDGKLEEEIHKKVVQSAYEIIRLKGYTSWAIGLSVASIVQGVMRNSRNVFALTVNIKGIHGFEDDIFLSLPTVLGSNGVNFIVRQNLTPKELEQLRRSATQLLEIQKTLKL